MPDTTDSVTITCQLWAPNEHALQLDRFGKGDDGRRIVLLASHPTAPFRCTLSAGPPETELRAMAHNYLVELETKFADRSLEFLPEGWLDSLAPGAGMPPHFGWLDINPALPVSSLALTRNDDETYILVAAQALIGTGIEEVIPSGFGLRVVIRRLDKDLGDYAITSMTAHLPDSRYLELANTLALLKTNRSRTAEIQKQARQLVDFLPNEIYREKISIAAGQDQETIKLAEVRFLPAVEGKNAAEIGLEIVTYGQKLPLPGQPADDKIARPFDAVTIEIRFDGDLGYSSKRTDQWPLHSGAMINVPVFTQVPTADSDAQTVFPPYRFIPRPSHDLTDAALRDKVSIKKVLKSPYFSVRNSPNFVLADKEKSTTAPYEVNLPSGDKIHPRSDLQSAISAHYFFNEFFKQSENFGLKPEKFLRRLNLPVHVHYRSGIAPGPGKDGNTINARVNLDNVKGVNFTNAGTARAHVHFARANLNRRRTDVPDDGSFAVRGAQPLGIANSRRWVLHEIGHLLVAGSLGELELRFVHSLGDALAAILCDPESRIAKLNEDDLWADLRFHTFPWVFVPRRHDRTVLTGWSWSGTMHRDVLHTPESQLRGLKGYETEQILSTTLFRLYRIIGGDTVNSDGTPDVPARRNASLVVFYLILRALESFAHWPLRAEELESALIDADLCLTTKLDNGLIKIWTGGQAHKVIRWAFEAQGLHPVDPDEINNKPGGPPPVDIFIQDQRDNLEPTFAGVIDHGPGSYVPASLHWSPTAPWVGRRITLGDKTVIFGNRGDNAPNNVTLRAWWGWRFVGDVIWFKTSVGTPDVTNFIDQGPVGLDDLGITVPSLNLNTNLFLLLEISAAEDRANTDPSTDFQSAISANGSPPSAIRDIAALVATDNNLGLFWVTL